MNDENSFANQLIVSAEGELVLDLSSVKKLLQTRTENVTAFDMSKKAAIDSANAASKIILGKENDVPTSIQISFGVNSNRIRASCEVKGSNELARIKAVTCVSAALTFLWDYSAKLQGQKEEKSRLAGIKNIRIVHR